MQRQRSKTVNLLGEGLFQLITFRANYNSDIRLHYSDYSNNIMAPTHGNTADSMFPSKCV